MKLSKLVYLCIKNVIYFDDTSFSYEEFVNGSFNSTPDYATNINNVFSPLNEAISRLSDLERIPYRVEECTVDKSGIILLEELEHDVKEVLNVAEVYSDGSYKKLAHRPFGIGKVHVTEYFNSFNKIFVEYKEDIPVFDETYMPYKNFYEEVEENPLDLDLTKYGITNSMCNYIIEYVQGKLYEQTSVEIANMHITRSEQYFNNVKPATASFSQQRVRNAYRIGD